MSKPATQSQARFDGSSSYVATDDLKLAVNAAMVLLHPIPFTPMVATRKVSVLKILL
jgi:hypothetical protein